MPNIELICSVSLLSDGFSTAKPLAKKMIVLYKLSKDQLTKQSHYDWGLRSFKNVLKFAGNYKLTLASSTENTIMMKALRDATCSKLIPEDIPLFLGLLKDLFPGVEYPKIHFPEFEKSVKQILEEENYILLPDQVGEFFFYILKA